MHLLLRGLFFLMLLIANPPHSFTQGGHHYKTSKFAGFYFRQEDDIEKGAFGNLIVYPESDTSILFDLQLNRGEPAYNMGETWGRLTLNTKDSIFIYKDETCKLQFAFTKRNIAITSFWEEYFCGYGNGVIADGHYKKVGRYPDDFFVTLGSDTISFKNMPNGNETIPD